MAARESAALLRALERVARGEPKSVAARKEGLAESTVFRAIKRRAIDLAQRRMIVRHG